MTVWHCPKCGWQTQQPAHVTGVTHRCNVNIPRAVRLQQIPPQTPQGETP